MPAGQTVRLAYFTIVTTTPGGGDCRRQRPGHAQRLRRPGGGLDLSQTLLNFGFDQPPVVSVGNAGPVTFIRGGAAVALAPDLTLSDPDSTTLASATVSISGGPLDSGAEILAATTAGTNITASYNAAAGTLTLSGTDTLADYQQVLQSVTYVDTLSTTTNLGNRTLNFTAGDGSLSTPGYRHGGLRHGPAGGGRLRLGERLEPGLPRRPGGRRRGRRHPGL